MTPARSGVTASARGSVRAGWAASTSRTPPAGVRSRSRWCGPSSRRTPGSGTGSPRRSPVPGGSTVSTPPRSSTPASTPPPPGWPPRSCPVPPSSRSSGATVRCRSARSCCCSPALPRPCRRSTRRVSSTATSSPAMSWWRLVPGSSGRCLLHPGGRRRVRPAGRSPHPRRLPQGHRNAARLRPAVHHTARRPQLLRPRLGRPGRRRRPYARHRHDRRPGQTLHHLLPAFGLTDPPLGPAAGRAGAACSSSRHRIDAMSVLVPARRRRLANGR